MYLAIPYTKVLDATRVSLRGYQYSTVRVKGKYGYSKFLKSCWDKGESFINIEHDSVLWPGAIESLKSCPQICCAFDYSSTTDWTQPNINSIPLGCMKITAEFMEKLPNIWNKPVDWRECDVYLFR